MRGKCARWEEIPCKNRKKAPIGKATLPNGGGCAGLRPDGPPDAESRHPH